LADCSRCFLEHYKSHRRHFDYYPVDAHWNGLGHRLAAQRAYDFLFRQPDGRCLTIVPSDCGRPRIS